MCCCRSGIFDTEAPRQQRIGCASSRSSHRRRQSLPPTTLRLVPSRSSRQENPSRPGLFPCSTTPSAARRGRCGCPRRRGPAAAHRVHQRRRIAAWRGASRATDRRTATGGGGSRPRVVGQLLVEHTLLGVAGAVAGVIRRLLADASVRRVGAGGPAAPRHGRGRARGAVFALTLGFWRSSCGVAPALSLARTPAARLAEGGRDAAAGRRVGHRIIVATAMALALVLLAGASLLGETLLRLTARPLGFDPSNLHVVSFTMTTLPEEPDARAINDTRPAQRRQLGRGDQVDPQLVAEHVRRHRTSRGAPGRRERRQRPVGPVPQRENDRSDPSDRTSRRRRRCHAASRCRRSVFPHDGDADTARARF